MGISYNTYVGPYIICKAENVVKSGVIEVCPKKNCNSYQKQIFSKFCAECGSQVENKSYQFEEKKVNPNSLTNELNDKLYACLSQPCVTMPKTESFVIWLPNRYTEDHFSFNPKENEFAKEITSDIIKNNMEAFNKNYEDGIQVIEKHYGKENMTIKWGIVHTMN